MFHIENNNNSIGPGMPRIDACESPSHYVSADHLQIGLFVHVDLPWFRHPFTLNSFKIASEQQLLDLRALDKPQFRYDPALSDVAALPSRPTEVNGPDDQTGRVPQAADLSGARYSTAGADDTRRRQLREHRKAVVRTEKSFLKAIGVVQRLNRGLVQGSREALQEVGGLVDQMVSVFLDNADVTLQVMGETGGADVHDHSLNVCVLSMMLVRGLQLDSERATTLGTGALLHDIGHVGMPGIVPRRGTVDASRDDRHIELGAQIGRQLALAPDVLAIIEQHHEFADGSGYPRGLVLEQIAPLARVVSLASYYDNLCNPANLALAMTPHEALSFIFVRGKTLFDARIFQVMVRALGVYPPGTIVKLSNDAIGMVVSVNPQTSLRPWVLLYDADLPREEAPLVNLAAEQDLSISRAIRPAMLPAPVHAYLSPHKHITYFFDPGPRMAQESS